MKERETPRTDAIWKARRPDSPAITAAELHTLACGLERQRDELAEALRFARKAIASFQRSMGYEHTHLPKIDAALAKLGDV